jgi:hypothetical protein
MALSEVFWGLVMTTASGIIVLSIKACLKANIDDVSFCYGLFKIHRIIKLDDIASGNDSDEGSGGGSLRLTPINNKPAELKI